MVPVMSSLSKISSKKWGHTGCLPNEKNRRLEEGGAQEKQRAGTGQSTPIYIYSLKEFIYGSLCTIPKADCDAAKFGTYVSVCHQ